MGRPPRAAEREWGLDGVCEGGEHQGLGPGECCVLQMGCEAVHLQVTRSRRPKHWHEHESPGTLRKRRSDAGPEGLDATDLRRASQTTLSGRAQP